MNDKNIALIDTVPTIEDLRKVPGFNPLLYVKEILYRGKLALTMPLRYKRLWFKRACPQGRIRLVERSLTDQMAVIEAQVFLDREGEAPFATFTATKEARNSQDDFLTAAKDAAMNGALESAGFGIKTEVPPTFLSEEGKGMSPATRTVPRTVTPAVKSAMRTPTAQTAAPLSDAAALLQSIATPAKEPEPTAVLADAPSKFDESMSVEEIRAVMTLEEAKAVVVPTGICKGWTLEQVAKQRSASLKFFAYGDESRNGRIVKAASLLLLEGPALAEAG